ncbi:TetR/AcrR family transcriptional regulator [Streptomyces sp. W16]|uniref:TetR/AcrR family transcriptional regulator n=1 Tax=Streptomyces sp. W16 TaxID=3076631 RepID=UPI00295AFF08|nr:TetR/AcrR family transcriptional regulator [Streptomyces sp. W16]MDV9169155.1 TetR/AcrR family transcriptional regulator [Streptomyces sp. W16]
MSTGVRQQRAAATRKQLIATGLALAERTGLADMSVNLVVAEAGVAKGTFFHHFGDRSEFLLALHTEFHDRVFAEIERTIAGMPPGRDRLLAVANAYLDECLRHRGVRALLLEARVDPAILGAIAARNKLVIQLSSPDFAAMGWAHVEPSAAMWNSAVVEAAILELDAGGHRQEVRAALEQFLRGPK